MQYLNTLKHMNTDVILNTFSMDKIMPEMPIQMFLIFMQIHHFYLH